MKASFTRAEKTTTKRAEKQTLAALLFTHVPRRSILRNSANFACSRFSEVVRYPQATPKQRQEYAIWGMRLESTPYRVWS